MTQIPSVPNYIQQEETQFEAPVSESTMQKVGGTNNFLLDNYAIPPGALFDFAGPESAVPPGYLVADGRTASRTTYANLFANIGTYWGVGDGLTTFNTPDARGYVKRGVDKTSIGQAGRDPDHAARTPTGTGGSEDVGSSQLDQVIDHTHTVPIGITANGPMGLQAQNQNSLQTTSSFGGNETRGKNIYVLVIVKT
jgi:microcystin-dependent protein